MPTEISSLVSSLGVMGEALGIGDSTDIKKKDKPKEKEYEDACLDRASTDTAFVTSAVNKEIRDDMQEITENLHLNLATEINPPLTPDTNQ